MNGWEINNGEEKSIILHWGEYGRKVIFQCKESQKYKGTFEDFVKIGIESKEKNESAFMSGLRTLYPDVWNLIPKNTKTMSFVAVMHTMALLGIR